MKGFVYVVQAGDTYRFKVGRTGNLPQRMRTLQLGSPTPLHLVGWFRADNSYREEAEWHRRLGINRRHGEWFDLPLKDLVTILGVCESYGREEPPTKALELDFEKEYHVFWEGSIYPIQIDDLDDEDPSCIYVGTQTVPGSTDIKRTWPPMQIEQHRNFPEIFPREYISDDPRGALLYHDLMGTSQEAIQFHRTCYQAMCDARAIRGIR